MSASQGHQSNRPPDGKRRPGEICRPSSLQEEHSSGTGHAVPRHLPPRPGHWPRFRGRSQGGRGLRESDTDLGFPFLLKLLCDLVQVDQPPWACFSNCKAMVEPGLEDLIVKSLVIILVCPQKLMSSQPKSRFRAEEDQSPNLVVFCVCVCGVGRGASLGH